MSCLLFRQLYDNVCIDNSFTHYYNLFRYICTALHKKSNEEKGSMNDA